MKSIFELLKATASAWIDQDMPRMGAALAFYSVFAIAPLFVIALWIAGLWFGEAAARRELFSQVSGLVGSSGGDAIQALVTAASKPKTGAWATVIAVATLLAGATGVFVELQDDLNSLWGVRRMAGRGVWNFFKNRLLSFALIAGIGFLLLVSLILSAGLSGLGQFIFRSPPAQATIWQALNFVISFGVITLLFAMLFKVLPDAKIAWRDVWIGAVLSALLFDLGKLLFGLYLGRSSVTSAYGAAGSLVVVLLWVYYSAQLLLFGAKFTEIYAKKCGSHLTPAPGAEPVTFKDSASHPGRAEQRTASSRS